MKIRSNANQTPAKLVARAASDGEIAAKDVVRITEDGETPAKLIARMAEDDEIAAKLIARITSPRWMAAKFVVDMTCAGAAIAQFLEAMKDAQAIGLDAVTVLAALANDVRWQAMTLMANGAAISASDLAAATGRDVDSAGKHLRVLRTAGAADWRAGADTRFTHYFIPEKFRPQPGVVDYGFCRLNFGGAEKRPRATKD